MATEKPRKLKLTKLDFLSSCDFPAQGEGGAALLLKRNADKFTLKAKVAKTSDELGLVFGYAFAASMDGGNTAHVDYQNDAIDPDFLKVVTEFIEAGGTTDVNHDFEKDGRIVYAWPLLPEINKAMGIESDVIGLAVAVKPSAETYKRFKDGELTGFSIAGEGIRSTLDKARKAKSRVSKGCLVTDEVDGHQHTIDVGEDGSLICSYNTSAGSEYGHTHEVVRGAEGGIEILADSGHSHMLADTQPGVVFVAPETIVVVDAIAARRVSPTTNRNSTSKVASKLPRSEDGASVESHKDKHMTTKANSEAPSANVDNEKITQLEKRNAHLERVAKMSGVHKAHYDSLAGEAQEAFLAKNEIERSQAIETAQSADPVEFELDGVAYRKSTANYSLAKRVRDQDEQIEKANIREIAKSHLGKLAGADDVHDFIVRAVKKSGGSKEQIDAALTAMKGWNEHAAKREVAPGSSGAIDNTSTSTPLEALTKGLVAFCKTNAISKVWTEGLDKFKATPEGAALKSAYEASLAAG